MGFNSGFKGLNLHSVCLKKTLHIFPPENWSFLLDYVYEECSLKPHAGKVVWVDIE